ncbi:hypothetical protein C6A37_01535 [Desulfobacteraceae bacterium SEEP-SAG9]|nr:hypothetical protein C6A37_01535 [Desulfobacteraceae bacterium SEEP-SAG9]
MKVKHPKFKHVFLVMDIIILTISIFLSLHIVMPDFWSISSNSYYFCLNHIGFCFLLVAIYIFSFRFNNLYKRDVVTSHYKQFILIIKAHIGATLVIIIFMVFSNIDYFTLYGKSLITNIVLFNLVLFTIIRAYFAKKIYRFMAIKKISHIKVLIIGADKAGNYAARELQQDPFADFSIIGFLDDYKENGEKINGQFHNLGKLNDLDKIVLNNDFDEILIAIDNAPYERLIHIVEKSLQTGKLVKIYSNLLNVIKEKMDVEHYSSIPVITLTQKPLNAPEWDEKRILDIILSFIALIIFSPLFLVAAICIKFSSKGPVIYKQERIGKDGKPFVFYKFRSMHMHTSDSRHKEFVQNFITKNDQCQNDNIKVYKITDDPRIFSFGNFIRKTSIDEFPQFFNVIKGDMALVGPRPCLEYEWNCYEDWHKKRLNILPGCTGLWQALGRSSVTFEEMVILDLYYISNMTLWLDLKIFLQTLPVVFLGKGGH